MTAQVCTGYLPIKKLNTKYLYKEHVVLEPKAPALSSDVLANRPPPPPTETTLNQEPNAGAESCFAS